MSVYRETDLPQHLYDDDFRLNVVVPGVDPMGVMAESSFAQTALDEEDEEDDDDYDFFELYEDSPDFEIPYDLIAELEEKEAIAAANKKPSAMDQHKLKIAAAIQRWRKHDSDVGSSEVQVAICHERVQYLTAHLLTNRKDVAARRGLDALVNDRRKFLNYLYRTNPEKAMQMVNELGIRYRAPTKYQDRESKYLAFKNTKSVKALDKLKEKRALRDSLAAKAAAK